MNFANMLAKLIKEYQGDRQLDALKACVVPRDCIEKPVRKNQTLAADDKTAISGFAMQELTIDGANANFLLNWNSVEDALGYRVYSRVKQSGEYTVVRELTKDEKDTATTLPFAAPAGEVYEYYVTTVFSDGKEGAASRVIEINAR